MLKIKNYSRGALITNFDKKGGHLIEKALIREGRLMEHLRYINIHNQFHKNQNHFMFGFIIIYPAIKI